MKKILVLTGCLAVSALLAGCSDADWNNALNYTGLGSGEDAAAEAPVQPVPATAAAAAPAQNDSFCRDVAAQDATGSGFDPADPGARLCPQLWAVHDDLHALTLTARR